MKNLLLIVFFLLYSNFAIGQPFYLKIKGKNSIENKSIDSIGYFSKHATIKAVVEEYNSFSKKIVGIGYLDFKNLGNLKSNDTTFVFSCELNNKIDLLYITVKNDAFFDIINEPKKDTVKLVFQESELFLSAISKKLENAGYSMSKVQLTSIKKKDGVLYSDLEFKLDKKRYLDAIIVNGYPKFPKNHKKNVARLFKNKTFNEENLERLYANINKFRFVTQSKYPEILFKKDSTQVYVYLEKTKSNTFDGILGFSNDEQSNLVFNGYLDLQLNNMMNSGERVSIFWKSDGQEQRTFNLDFELPYLFNTPIGLKTELQIFKQDSTFQNTKISLNLGYFFNYSTRLYLGYDTVESSDIQNINSAAISDFENKFITSAFEYTDYDRTEILFPEKTVFNLKIGNGQRNSKLQKNNQFYSSLNVRQNIKMNDRNSINIKLEAFYLQSDAYFSNELKRFGGINSIRGFNENSLQANLVSSIQSEYRYKLSSNLYAHTLLDYGYYEDNINTLKNTIFGIGFGFGVLTKNGLLNIIYANGSSKEQNIKLANSIIHISLKANF